uniref:TLC domain-containing protein n=1 Tax=Euplotes harpa TaxID=151035 RepID=A0A7S3J5G7_9SPIT|mmetsp:Transcript_2091/g.2654  ORF Transcript_2091/g.2654 Transcript_2091/m.2654 type:complete len:159 (+) Transcript_2091:191-667(+)
MIAFVIFNILLFTFLIGMFVFFITSVFIFDSLTVFIILSLITLILLLLDVYWCYRVIKTKKEESMYITKILAMSKDGYETEISRVQSKRNLFKFIKTYMTKETNFVKHPEEYWWKRRVNYRKQEIEESYQQFIMNVAPQQEQEDFAYEGIFDKKSTNK